MIVASFYAHRYDKWGADYIALLRLLDASCKRLGLRHMVIGDKAIPRIDTAIFKLPENLMLAFVDGQRQFLSWAQEPILLVGADCLVTRDPAPFMSGDITITTGPFSDCVMNSGAIWCNHPGRCAEVWQDALDRKPLEWGDDQRALYASIMSSDLAVKQVRCEDHNWAPDSEDDPAGMPTVAHFRGRRKSFMGAWARQHLGVTA